MNNQFDELTKGLAQSVTRRGALKKFGVGVAGLALASLGLANKAEADPRPPPPCLAPGTICCHGFSSGQAKKRARQCQQQCCSGDSTNPMPGVFVCR
jgi:hypothetical protein